MRKPLIAFTTAVFMAAAGGGAAMAASNSHAKSVVLVHGGFVDGSGWEGVYYILKKDGYDVTIVQNPTISLTDDVAVTKRAIAAAKGDVILVGHSYGGAIITEAGTDPKVKGLVYVAAFAPDADESVASILSKPEKDDPVPPIVAPVEGYLFLDKEKFQASFAADVRDDLAAFMADSQVPWNVACLEAKNTHPAWKDKPSWYLLATTDRMIPPRVQKMMAERAGASIVEEAGSHAIYVSKPEAVARLIEQAADGVRSD